MILMVIFICIQRIVMVRFLSRHVEANIAKGYKFMVITDHSQSLRVANGLQVERLLRQNEEIKALDKEYSEIDIYSGTEIDIT